MIFGWDISTSIIGMAMFDDEGKFVRSDYLDLRKEEKDLIEKSHAAATWIEKIADEQALSKNYEHVHYIEDRLGGFSAGKTMQQTLLKLAAFNSTVSYIVWRSFWSRGLGGYVEHIHPSTVKSIMRKQGLIIEKGQDKKELTLTFVSRTEPLFKIELNKNENPQPWCYDMSDAYITARSGHIRSYLSKDASREKDTGDKKNSGP